jgi:hypothetical protein
MSRKEFSDAMKDRGKTFPGRVKLRWKCTTDPSHTWPASYNNVKEGSGCIYCAEAYGLVGTQLHKIIQYIITRFLLPLKAYSEVIVTHEKVRDGSVRKSRVDSLILNINNRKYLSDRLLNHPRLLKEIRLNEKFLKHTKAFMFDYTSDLSIKNIKEKARKYQKEDIILFIVGTKWKKWKRNTNKRVLDTIYKNVRVIKYDLFADLIGLTGKLYSDFRHALGLHDSLDLEALLELSGILRSEFIHTFERDLFRTRDLVFDLREINIDYHSFLGIKKI